VNDDPIIDSLIGNRYRIVQRLGEGGMSIVYEVQHTRLKRAFALKVLLPALLDNEEAVIRFEREAELLAGLRHPNIVDIVDFDELLNGTPFMVLEFLHGAPLRNRLDRGALPWAEIARIGDEAMSALSLAHRRGITHRDLKPENLFNSIDDVGEERIKILDFGVSKVHGRVSRTTGQHEMLGTPSYMSPEQTSGDPDLVGPATDVWAMGAILYEMATGCVAYTGETLVQTITNINSTPPVPLTTYRPEAPPAFASLVERAMSLDPGRRIQSIDELRVELRRALGAHTIAQLPTAVFGIAALGHPVGSGMATPPPRPTPLPEPVGLSVRIKPKRS